MTPRKIFSSGQSTQMRIYLMDDDSADDKLTESELSSEDYFEVEDVNLPWKKSKLINSHFYHKILCSALVFFAQFQLLLLRDLCMVIYCCFSFSWLRTFTVVACFTFSWLVVTKHPFLNFLAWHQLLKLKNLIFFWFDASIFGHLTVLFLEFLKSLLYYFKDWNMSEKSEIFVRFGYKFFKSYLAKVLP